MPSDEPPIARLRAARLAHAAATSARLAHDLRGIFSPALLAADRLTQHADPAARRAAEAMTRAIDRATEALDRAQTALRDHAEMPARTPVRLRDAVGSVSGMAVANAIPGDALVLAEAATLAEAFACLLAHARDQEATRAELQAAARERRWVVTIAHDGASPPPAGSLDLLTARAWLLAMGGTLSDEPGRLVVELDGG